MAKIDTSNIPVTNTKTAIWIPSGLVHPLEIILQRDGTPYEDITCERAEIDAYKPEKELTVNIPSHHKDAIISYLDADRLIETIYRVWREKDDDVEKDKQRMLELAKQYYPDEVWE